MKKNQPLKFSNLKRLAELINKHAPDHPHFSMKAAFLSAKETGFSEDTVKLDLYVDKIMSCIDVLAIRKIEKSLTG